MSALVVWRDTRRVGRLDTATNGDVRFTYDASVVADPQPTDRVGFRCPVRAAPYVGPDAAAVFENLLPEGGLRDALGQATKHDPSDTVGLLGVVGAECAGALQLWPEDVEPPANAMYDAVNETTLLTAFASAGGQLRQVTGRASLSGAQPKLVLWRRPPVGTTADHTDDHRPEYRLPRDGAPTTVVVKRPSSSSPGVLEAELVGMRLMEAAGVPTASSAPCLVSPTCHESARFDRTMGPDGTVHRVHAEDGCQLTGRVSRQKYAGPSGVTYHDLVAVLRRAGVQPAADREQLLRWAVANAVMGNYDAHAKNLSVLYDAEGTVRLAPAYDVVVTTVFADLEQTFALAFAGTTHPAALTPQQLRRVAREFDVALPQVTALTADVLARVREALPSVLHVVRGLGGDEKVLDRVHVGVTATADAFAARLAL